MFKQKVRIEGGSFLMGSNRHYAEERPERVVHVDSFSMDSFPVRNLDFAAFVAASAYVTVAERQGHSHVFQMTETPVALNNPDQWWKAVPGACWRNPRPGTSLPADFEKHPVVHIALQDAKAFAAWCGGQLPTEAEWEYAAKGGQLSAHLNTEFAWGDEFAPGGQRMAHVWQGAFPWYYAQGGVPSSAAVGQFPADLLGLLDMIGNVWEWTQTAIDQASTCCSCSPKQDDDRLWVLKGGSHLCAAEYCLRYRPAARMGVAGVSSTSHIGFRCVYRGS